VLFALGLALCATPLRAQISQDSLGWRFLGNFAYVQTSGNSRLSTVSLADRLIFRPSTRWQFQQTASWTYSASPSTNPADSGKVKPTANQILARFRADYYLSGALSLYGFGGYERNTFAGIDSRFEEALGLSWQAVRSGRHQVDLEAGVSNNQQQSPNTSLVSFPASRLAGRYRYGITATAYVEEAAELLSNLDHTGDERANSLTSLVAPISSAIGIRVSYLARYNSEPPAGVGYKLDTTFSTGLQFTF